MNQKRESEVLINPFLFNTPLKTSLNDKLFVQDRLTAYDKFLSQSLSGLAKYIDSPIVVSKVIPPIEDLFHFGNAHSRYNIFSPNFDISVFESRSGIYEKINQLKKRFEKTHDAKYLLEIKEILNEEKSRNLNKINDVKKYINRTVARLYYNESTHKIFSKKILRQLFKKSNDKCEDETNNLSLVDMSRDYCVTFKAFKNEKFGIRKMG